jgi:aminoglycoside 6'-N-acetyltransferase I
VNIVKVTQNDFREWLDLALKLWPDYTVEEMQGDLVKILQSPREEQFLVRDSDGKAIAFMNLSLRYEYVPGASQSPVAFVEGIYVQDEYQNQGIGTYLIRYAEQWALAQGCTQLASDALLENTGSYQFHTKVGFQEVEKVVSFIKQLASSD